MIHIALTLDKKFTRFCAVAMASILEHNEGKNVKFHILTDYLPPQDCNALQTIANRYYSDITFYTVPPEKVANYDIRWEQHRISIVTFYRCMLASILPHQISKVLYLDCDLLVLQNLNELWNTNIEEYALAAIPDDFEINIKHPSRLGYDPNYNYFNGGVLLLNLDYWRKNHIEEQMISYYVNNPEKVIYNDQDLLNGLLYDKKLLVSMKWNVQEAAYRQRHKAYQKEPSYISLIKNPAILHYSSRKPWQYHCMHPMLDLFYKYQDLTPWKGTNVLNHWKARLHRAFHLLPYTLGLKKDKYIHFN